MAVGLSVMSLLAQMTAGAEAAPVQKAPVAVERVVEAPVFRMAIDGYIREQNRQMRETLNEDLRRQLPGKIVLSTNELRTRT
jgi:hypothetical protein